MKKRFTLQEESKRRVIYTTKKENPSDTTIDFIKQFARVYSVEKVKNGSTIGLILN